VFDLPLLSSSGCSITQHLTKSRVALASSNDEWPVVPSPVWIEVLRYSRALSATNEICSKQATAVNIERQQRGQETTKVPGKECGHDGHSHVISFQSPLMLAGAHKLTVREELSGREGRLYACRGRPYRLPGYELFATL